ncbi:MAG: hypothetical protein KKA07_14760, partial [Bacteroidetes bacterium]|nr:hypothetical protein [Bacteroidota bacterium]
SIEPVIKDVVKVEALPGVSGSPKKGIVTDRSHLRPMDSPLDKPLTKAKMIGPKLELHEEVKIFDTVDNLGESWHVVELNTGLRGYIRASKVRDIGESASLKEGMTTVSASKESEDLIKGITPDEGGGFLTRNFRFFRGKANEELQEAERQENEAKMTEFIKRSFLMNNILQDMKVQDKLYTKEGLIFDIAGSVGVFGQKIPFTSTFKTKFKNYDIQLMSFNVPGFRVAFGSTLAINFNNISIGKTEAGLTINIASVGLELTLMGHTATASVTGFKYDQNGQLDFNTATLSYGDSFQLGALPITLSNLNLTLMKQDIPDSSEKAILISGGANIAADSFALPGLTVNTAEGAVVATYNISERAFNLEFNNVNLEAELCGQKLNIRNLSYANGAVNIASAEMTLNAFNKEIKLSVAGAVINSTGFSFTTISGEMSDVPLWGTPVTLPRIMLSLTKSGADYTLHGEAEFSTAGFNLGSGIEVTSAAGKVSGDYDTGTKAMLLSLTNGAIAAKILGQGFALENVTADSTGIRASNASLVLDIGGYTGDFQIKSPGITGTGFNFDEISGKFADFSVGGGVLNFSNIAGSVTKGSGVYILRGESVVEVTNFSPVPGLQNIAGSGKMAMEYNTGGGMDVKLTDCGLTAEILGQKLTINQLSATKEAVSADSATVDLNIFGKTGQATIVNPSATKSGGFDFASASGSLQDLSMFNGQLNVVGTAMTVEKRGPGDYLFRGTGKLSANFFGGLTAEAAGGFTYDGKTAPKPFFTNAHIGYSQDIGIPGITGLKINGLSLDITNGEAGDGLIFKGNANLIYEHADPTVKLSAGIEVTFNQNKEFSCKIATASLTTVMGTIAVTGLTYNNNNIHIDNGTLSITTGIPDSATSFFEGAGLDYFSNIFGMGLAFDINAQDINISSAGLKIAKITNSLNEIKFNLFGVEVNYNVKTGEGSITKEFGFPGEIIGEKASVSFDIPVFPGVGVIFGAGLEAKGKTAVKLQFTREESGGQKLLHVTLSANLMNVELWAFIEGGAYAGVGILAKIYAKLRGKGGVVFTSGALTADTVFEPASGSKAGGSGIMPKVKNVDVGYNFDVPVMLALDLILGFQALYFFKKEYAMRLAEKELTRFSKSGSFQWSNASASPQSQSPDAMLDSTGAPSESLMDKKPNEQHLRDLEKMDYLSRKIMSTVDFEGFISWVSNQSKQDALFESLRSEHQGERSTAESGVSSNTARMVMKGVTNKATALALQQGYSGKNEMEAQNVMNHILMRTFYNPLLMRGVPQDMLDIYVSDVKEQINTLFAHKDYKQLRELYTNSGGVIDRNYATVAVVTDLQNQSEQEKEAMGRMSAGVEGERQGVYKYFSVKSNEYEPYKSIAAKLDSYAELRETVGPDNITDFIAKHRDRAAIFEAANELKSDVLSSVILRTGHYNEKVTNFITLYNSKKGSLGE